MPDNTTKLVIFGAVYLILFAYENYYPYFKNRQQHLTHSLNNLVLATINVFVSVVFFVTALHHVCSWTEQTNMGLLNQITISPIYAYLLALLLIDFWQYVWHRLNHKIAFLWRFHQL